MKYRMKIFLDGQTYYSNSAEVTKSEFEDMVERWYESASNLNVFQMKLEDGSFLILPKEAIRRAHIIFEVSEKE